MERCVVWRMSKCRVDGWVFEMQIHAVCRVRSSGWCVPYFAVQARRFVLGANDVDHCLMRQSVCCVRRSLFRRRWPKTGQSTSLPGEDYNDDDHNHDYENERETDCQTEAQTVARFVACNNNNTPTDTIFTASSVAICWYYGHYVCIFAPRTQS